jgi:hypothetical protein
MEKQMTPTLPIPVFWSRVRVLFAFLVFVSLVSAPAQHPGNAMPKVADQPLTSEQLAVYRTMLVSWFQGEKAKVNLAVFTDPVGTNGDSLDKGCLKSLSLEAAPLGQVHRIRTEDLAQFGPFEFRLVDPKAGEKEVSDNDPGLAIHRGKPVDEAVENGFAHGLLTLGEIQFDKTHTHALASFRFACGRLCGNGTTMLLEKKDGTWRKQAECGGWVS